MTKEELLSIFYQYEAESIILDCQAYDTELVMGVVEIGIRTITWVYNKSKQHFVSIGGYDVQPKG